MNGIHGIPAIGSRGAPGIGEPWWKEEFRAVDLADFAGVDAVYADFFPQPRPARTTVGATLREIKVEIDCVAVLPFDAAAETTA